MIVSEMLVESWLFPNGCRTQVSANGNVHQRQILDNLIDLWSHTYDCELGDAFAVQEEISGTVRDVFVPHLGGQAPPTPAKSHTPSVDAHELYMKGRYSQARLVSGSVVQAVGFFEQTIVADPKYARDHAGLADAWFFPHSGAWFDTTRRFQKPKPRRNERWNWTITCSRRTLRLERSTLGAIRTGPRATAVSSALLSSIPIQRLRTRRAGLKPVQPA